MDNSIKALNIEVDGLTIAALHQPASNSSNEIKLLCLHGWLDNANSFVGLMPYLQDYELVAIDLPGHGHSSHLGSAAEYHLSDMSFVVLKIAQQLGWKKFHLVGHSMGGGISCITAAAAPQTIASLVLLDSSGPLTEEPDELPARLQRAREHRLKPGAFISRTFTDKQQAVDTRLAAAKMHEESARLIIERQLREVDDGYQWRFDPRQRNASAVWMTEPQVLAMLGAIACPVQAIIAKEGYPAKREETATRLDNIPNSTISQVAGNHHTHMDDPASTAACMIKHYASYSDQLER